MTRKETLKAEITKSILAARTIYQHTYEEEQYITRGSIPQETATKYHLKDNHRNNGEGCYTFNPTEDCIIAPKEHGLGTEEDHYRETKSEEDLDKGDES